MSQVAVAEDPREAAELERSKLLAKEALNVSVELVRLLHEVIDAKKFDDVFIRHYRLSSYAAVVQLLVERIR